MMKLLPTSRTSRSQKCRVDKARSAYPPIRRDHPLVETLRFFHPALTRFRFTWKAAPVLDLRYILVTNCEDLTDKRLIMKPAMPVSLMELLAIPLGCQKTATKCLVITPTLWMKQPAVRPGCQRPQPSRWLSRLRGERSEGSEAGQTNATRVLR